MSLCAVIFTAVMGSYLFLGRNLTRLVNFQRQEVESRRTLRQFTQDLSAAISLTTATSTDVALTMPTASGTTAVSYSYSSGSGTLTRTDSIGTQTVLSGVTAFALSYFNQAGSSVASGTQSIKAVEFSYSAGAGSSASGTLASSTTVSSRVLLRNKPALL